MDNIIAKSKAEELISSTKICVISGSFDLLHIGHIKFLNSVRERLDPDVKIMLIVLGDDQIKLRKGDDRPIFDLQTRIETLSSLRQIDYLLPWKETWQELRDFVIKTKPYAMAIVEGDPGENNKIELAITYGINIIVLPKYKSHSTSALIAKIQTI